MATTTDFKSGFSDANTSPTPFKPNPKEVEAIGHALRQPEFRAMLAEYAKEVSDPENQKLFREEMSELEAQRGFMATFLQPQPGYVIKTRVLSSCQNEDEDSALGFGEFFSPCFFKIVSFEKRSSIYMYRTFWNYSYK